MPHSGAHQVSISKGGKTLTLNVIGLKLETETEATIPSDRTRKKLGVGEKATLTLQPSSLSSVAWSISGSGTLSSTSGNPVTFTASDRASTPSITATCEGCSLTIDFTVVEPAGVIFEQEAGTGIWHINGYASAGFKGRPYITPNDVSFVNIEVREQSCVGTGTGYYSELNGLVHPVGSWGSVSTGTTEKPNKFDLVDKVESGIGASPFSDGTFTWLIPWEFRVGSGNAKVFTTVPQQQDTDSAGKVTISKGGISVNKNAGDPTSGY